MGWARNRGMAWRGATLTLAILALALKLIVPPGFMVADHGGSYPITICTGHGPLIVNSSDPGGSKAPVQKKTDAPCTGAGNVTPPAPMLTVAISAPYAAEAEGPTAGLVDSLFPGRGLAAPPPPSQAPPFALA